MKKYETNTSNNFLLTLLCGNNLPRIKLFEV